MWEGGFRPGVSDPTRQPMAPRALFFAAPAPAPPGGGPDPDDLLTLEQRLDLEIMRREAQDLPREALVDHLLDFARLYFRKETLLRRLGFGGPPLPPRRP